jgi:uncharacterized protein with PQ loop repeat
MDCMKLKDVIGIIAMLATLGQVLFGMTSQIRKLHVERSIKGLAFTAIGTMCFGFAAWTGYSLVPPVNIYVLVPNAMGTIFSAIILVQMIMIQRRKG